VLLHARYSPLLPLLPPRLFYQLLRASQEVTILRKLRKRRRPVVKRALLPPSVPSPVAGQPDHGDQHQDASGF
jgi:hypothetical protein